MSGGVVIARNLIDRWTVLALAGAGVFMFWAAGHYTVFDDEAFSCRRYVMPVGDMVSALWRGTEPDPPLYYLLENIWVRVFGVGPLGLRSLSILFFLAGLVFIRLAGQAWYTQATGLTVMFLCAIHPAHLFLGFAGRWYSLMFLTTAVVLWLTARLSAAANVSRNWSFCWSIGAACACYTNYFGVVVVTLAWAAGLLRSRGYPDGVRRWIRAGLGLLILYAVWLPALWRTAAELPSIGGSWTSHVASFARTFATLLAGNLVSVGAWWAWVPLGVFAICLLVLLVNEWRAVWPIGVIALGSLAAGVLSHTMIDKYVMTISGAVWLLIAAMLVHGFASPRSKDVRVAVRIAVVCLAVGWLGCGVNLVTQRHWSSLRWQDPFEQVIAELAGRDDLPPPDRWVMTHPSARYYFGLYRCRETDTEFGRSSRRVDAQRWRRYAEPPNRTLGNFEIACATPTSVLDSMMTGPAPSIVTVETAGFREPADDWGELHALLDRAFVEVEVERKEYLEDPDAAWKDRTDPHYQHPKWRIVVKRWAVRTDAGEG
ncbi:MAG: hypothetical protein ABII12_00420 [Planctomycetota bacterium]